MICSFQFKPCSYLFKHLKNNCHLFSSVENYYYYFFKILFIHSWKTQRERQRHRQREKQTPCREPDAGLDPGTLGSCPEPRAGAQPLSHPSIPARQFLKSARCVSSLQISANSIQTPSDSYLDKWLNVTWMNKLKIRCSSWVGWQNLY